MSIQIADNYLTNICKWNRLICLNILITPKKLMMRQQNTSPRF